MTYPLNGVIISNLNSSTLTRELQITISLNHVCQEYNVGEKFQITVDAEFVIHHVICYNYMNYFKF